MHARTCLPEYREHKELFKRESVEMATFGCSLLWEDEQILVQPAAQISSNHIAMTDLCLLLCGC